MVPMNGHVMVATERPAQTRMALILAALAERLPTPPPVFAGVVPGAGRGSPDPALLRAGRGSPDSAPPLRGCRPGRCGAGRETRPQRRV